MKKILILFILMLTIQPTYAFWANTINGASSTANGQVLVGSWPLPLDIETVYEPGDEFIFDDQVWEVVDINEPVEPGETRMLVLVPGEGIILVAITGDGNGNTIVVRIE